jgi:protein-S-isoprenylcysteine O-methyltransferase Ste14
MIEPRLRPSSTTAKLGLSFLMLAGVAYAGYSQLAFDPRAPDYSQGGWIWFDLVVYAAVTALVLVNVWRRPAANSEDNRLSTWIVCLACYAYPLAYEPGETFTWVIVFHVLGDSSLIYLGRSFAVMPARRAIKTGWLYRVVRHPTYATYLLADVSYCVAVLSVQNLAVAGLGVALLVTRARLEERVLADDVAYQEYRQRTRYRFFPGLY